MSNLIGFLSPEGEFFKCDSEEHHLLATKLIENFEYNQTNNCQIELANNGWCFFQTNFAGIPAETSPVPKISDSQAKWIEANYDKLNRKQKYFISEKLKLDDDGCYGFLPREMKNVAYPGIA